MKIAGVVSEVHEKLCWKRLSRGPKTLKSLVERARWHWKVRDRSDNQRARKDRSVYESLDLTRGQLPWITLKVRVCYTL